MDSVTTGILETLLTAGLRDALGVKYSASRIEPVDIHRQLARYLGRSIEAAVRAYPSDERAERGVLLANQILDALAAASPKSGLGRSDYVVEPASLVLGVEAEDLRRPSTPLSESALFTNAPDEPRLGEEIGRELLSCDRADALVAFVRWSGIRLIEPQLRRFFESGRRLRLITTTYTGATERTALDRLHRMGAEIKVSYDERSTRLHAKAWLFHRNTGYHTAWIGSSNLSRAAMIDGLEWNVRASSVTTPEIVEKFAGTFEAYWEDPHFETYEPDRDAERFDRETRRATTDQPIDFSFIDVRPYPFQQQMLDRLEIERTRYDRHRNLVVAATGTGKTMVAAMDYARLAKNGPAPSLLFVAHREEILNQSMSAFRAVMRDGAIGEAWVRGQRPADGRHVFASIQSLASAGVDAFLPDHYDIVIVDEFHHAAARTYRTLLDHVEPVELLGLTATPERADGQSVLAWFGDRIAVELRLWDALDQDLLVPFHYFGIHDDVDLSGLTWTRGGYQTAELDSLYTGNDARVRLILQAIEDKIVDPGSIKALGFCVSVAHAEYMAARFNEAQIPSVAVSASTPAAERAQALRDLKDGRIGVVFAVDLFNEGVDVPDIDTVLFLRPTESATIFLQQLGRGLRRAKNKAVLTVLDFVGQQNRKFRFDMKLHALTGRSRVELIEDVAGGFPYLPSGCHIDLDRVARDVVLQNLKSALPTRWPERVVELKSIGNVTLAEFLDVTGLSVGDIYRGGRSWTQLRRAAEIEGRPPSEWDDKLGRAFGRMLHIEDALRLSFYERILTEGHPPDENAFDDFHRRLLFMLHLSLWGVGTKFSTMNEGFTRLWEAEPMRAELVELLDVLGQSAEHIHRPLDVVSVSPLLLHARYSRDEVLAALGVGSPPKPPSMREGVKWVPDAESDVFMFQLQKSEKYFSPSTRYNDYAISPDLFHWESQSTTSVRSRTGQRYINHRERGTKVLLFARERRQTEIGTAAPYLFLGPADYVTHTGDRPIAITWKLRVRMPPDFYNRAKLAAGS